MTDANETNDNDEVDAIAWYLIDLLCDGIDETVRVPRDSDGEIIIDLAAHSLIGFRVESTNDDGKKCTIGVLVGRPKEVLDLNIPVVSVPNPKNTT